MYGGSSATAKFTRAPLCSFGTVVNGIIPFSIDNLYSVMVDTVQAFGMGIDERISYDDWNIRVVICSTNNIDIDNDDNYNDKWKTFSRSATPRPSTKNYLSKFHFIYNLILLK